MFASKPSFVTELVLTLGVVAVVGTVSAVAINAARSRQRDAVRLSTISRVQSALENYFNETNLYPLDVDVPLGDVAQAACLGSSGFSSNCTNDIHRFLRVIPPTISTGLEGLVRCGTPSRDAFCYSASSDARSYGIEFELENALPDAGLASGVNCAIPEKMFAGPCPP